MHGFGGNRRGMGDQRMGLFSSAAGALSPRRVGGVFGSSGLLVSVIPAIWLIVGLAFVLRIVNLGAESLWYDEAFTAWIVKLPPSQAMSAIAGDVHPPLYYFVMQLFTGVFGYSEFALRLPSALFGTLSVFLLWKVGQAAGVSERAALVGALLLALMPAHLYYSQDARMYPLLTCLILLSFWGVLTKRPTFFVLAGIVALYTHNLAWFYVGGIALTWLWRRDQEAAEQVLSAAGGIVLAGLPWLGVLVTQAGELKDGFWLQQPMLGGIFAPIMSMTMGWRIPNGLHPTAYIVACTATILSVWVAWRRRQGVGLLVVVFGVPAGIAVVSYLWQPVYLLRGLLPATSLLMLLWGILLTETNRADRRVARLLVGLCIAVGVVAHYFPQGGGRDPMRQWAGIVRAAWQPGDTIYYTSISATVLMGYYLDDLPYAMRPHTSDLNQSLTEETKAAMGFTIKAWEDLPAGRVWLVYGINAMSRADEIAFVGEITAGKTPVFSVNKRFSEIAIYLIERTEK